MRQILTIALWLGVAGCDILGPGPVRRELEIAAHKAGCVALGPTLCLLAREPGDSTFGLLYEHPVGFQFEWGVEQTILVREEELDEVPADASSIVRHVERVVSRSRVAPGTAFELGVPSERLRRAGDAALGIEGESVVVPCEAAVCGAVLAAAATAPRIMLELRFASGPDRPLEMTGWRACAEDGGPCGS